MADKGQSPAFAVMHTPGNYAKCLSSETHLSRQSVTGAYDSQRQMADDLCEYEKQRMENVKRTMQSSLKAGRIGGLEAPVLYSV